MSTVEATQEDVQFDFDKEMLPADSSKRKMLEVNASSSDLWKVKVEDLYVEPGLNPRSNNESLQAHIRSIADSIKSEGYYQDKPIAAFVKQDASGTKIVVTDGHNRLAAVKLAIQEGAKIAKLPVVIAPKGTTIEDITVALARTSSGRRLDPYETAILCKRLSRFGWEIAEIATRLGRRPGEVELMLELVAAPRHVRALLESGQVKASLAMSMLEKHGNKAFALLQKMADRSKKEGSKRTMPRHAPGAKFERHVRKAAPNLFTTIGQVKSDPGYVHISEELRSKIDTLFAELENARKDAE